MYDVGRDAVLRRALAERPALWAYSLGLTRNPQQAEDLFQESHVVICGKWQQLRPDQPFLAWAFTIIRLTWLASLHDKHRRMAPLKDEVLERCVQEAVDDEEGPQGDRLARLRACLEQLTPRARSALDLRYAQGLDCSRIAQRLTMGVKALYQLLSRSRVMLEDCVRRTGTT